MTVPKQLRAHQVAGIEGMRNSLVRLRREGRPPRVQLKLPTGAGKTFTAAAIVLSALAKGKRILFVVDAISLIDQTVEAFHSQGIGGIGVIQADHPMTDYSKPVQVASVQTLRRRGMPSGGVDIVIVDESHCQDEWLSNIMASETWADIPFIGLSATPWSKGLGNLYFDLISPVTMAELIELGLLCPFRVFAVSHPDLSGVKTKAGDYQQDQLSEVMAAGNLVADLVDTWQQRAEGRPTFVFAVDRAHAKSIQRRFEQAGIGAGYIDAFTKVPERKAIRAQLDRGEIKIVCNVGCLTKGVDWAIGCIVLARPTKSEMLYVQMVGRGLRVNEGIPDCIILDHADNTLRMGFVTDVDAVPREMCTAKRGERTKSEREVPLPKECPKCHFLKAPKVRQCPGCGFMPEKQTDVQETDGELIEVKRGKNKLADATEKRSWIGQLNWIARERHYSSGWVSQNYKKKFGSWPQLHNHSGLEQPGPAVTRFVRSQLIAFAHRRAA